MPKWELERAVHTVVSDWRGKLANNTGSVLLGMMTA